MSNPQVPTDDDGRDGFLSEWLPRLHREERRELSLRVAGGAVADADFIVMMCKMVFEMAADLLDLRNFDHVRDPTGRHFLRMSAS